MKKISQWYEIVVGIFAIVVLAVSWMNLKTAQQNSIIKLPKLSWGQKCNKHEECASNRCWTNEWTDELESQCVAEKHSLSESEQCLFTHEIKDPEECKENLVCYSGNKEDRCVPRAMLNSLPKSCLIFSPTDKGELICSKYKKY